VDTKDGVAQETRADMVMDPKVVTKDGARKDNGEVMDPRADTLDLKETEDHKEEHQTVDPKEVTETGTGTDLVVLKAVLRADLLVPEVLRVKCTVAEVPTLPVEALAALLHQVLVELPAPKPPKKPRSTAAEVATVATTATAMVTAVVTEWKVIKDIEVVIHRMAVRKGTARAQAMVIQKEFLHPVA